jgi:hypothetical protein
MAAQKNVAKTPPVKSGKTPRKPKVAERAQAGGQPKLSALAAAAKVLAETGRAMTCKELIATMPPRVTGAVPPARRLKRRCTRL